MPHDDSLLSATKKCPACGFWSSWQQRPEDRCERCGQLLDPQRLRSEQARQKQADEPLPSFMQIQIGPDDSPTVRFFKQIIRGGQLAFAAVVSFMVWFLTLLAG